MDPKTTLYLLLLWIIVQSVRQWTTSPGAVSAASGQITPRERPAEAGLSLRSLDTPTALYLPALSHDDDKQAHEDELRRGAETSPPRPAVAGRPSRA